MIEIKPPNPGTLAEALLTIREQPGDVDSKRHAILQLTIGLVNAAGVLLFQQGPDGLQLHNQLVAKQAESWSDNLAEDCLEFARGACASATASVTPLPDLPQVKVISCPFSTSNNQESCLCAIIFLGDAQVEPFLIILQLIATVIGGLDNVPTQPDTSLLKGLLQEVTSADRYSFLDYLKSATGAALVAVGTQKGNGPLRLQAISDVVQIDHRTEQSRLYIRVMEECVSSQTQLAWPEATDKASTSLVLKELLRDVKLPSGNTLLFATRQAEKAIIVLLFQKQPSDRTRLEQLAALAPVLAPHVYTVFTQSSGGARQGTSTTRLKKVFLATCFSIALLIIALLPVNYKISQSCWVEPQGIQYVVAQFDALLSDVYVKPGASIKAGAPLAQLDGREIELELGALEADINKAVKASDAYMAGGDVAMAQMAELERKRLEERKQLLTGRLEYLLVKSPLNGVTLSSDLSKQKGGPVSRGQVLFEIAPLETVELELGIEDREVAHVNEGMAVKILFDAYPDQQWAGKIQRIAPKSSQKEGKNYFTASFELDNSNQLLQPGMEGTAVITSTKKPLLWVYFHKQWYALKRFLFSVL